MFVRPHLTDVIGVKEGGHGLSGGGVGLRGLGSSTALLILLSSLRVPSILNV